MKIIKLKQFRISNYNTFSLLSQTNKIINVLQMDGSFYDGDNKQMLYVKSMFISKYLHISLYNHENVIIRYWYRKM